MRRKPKVLRRSGERGKAEIPKEREKAEIPKEQKEAETKEAGIQGKP